MYTTIKTRLSTVVKQLNKETADLHLWHAVKHFATVIYSTTISPWPLAILAVVIKHK